MTINNLFIDTATALDANVLLQELDIMKKIRPHPNIVNLLGYCTLPGECMGGAGSVWGGAGSVWGGADSV